MDHEQKKKKKFFDEGHRTSRIGGNNIVLVGLSGCGKSSTGALLARFLGYGFLDVDRWIETNAGKSIARIVSESGEETFRKLETEALNEISQVRNNVIAVGSGALGFEENRKNLKKLGTMMWLNCSLESIVHRFILRPEEMKKRPLLSDISLIAEPAKKKEMLRQRLGELLQERKKFYEESDFVVCEDFSMVEDRALYLKTILRNRHFYKHLRVDFLPPKAEQQSHQ